MEDRPNLHPYRDKAHTPRLVRIAAWCTSIFAVITAFVYLVALDDVLSYAANPTPGTVPVLIYVLVGLAAFWAICPPIWFWYEYYYVYLALDEAERGSFEGLKYGQQLATGIWAALLLVQALVLSALF